MRTNSAARRQHIIAEKEARIQHENKKQRRKIILRSVIGLVLTVSILLPLVMVSFNALSAGANQSATASSGGTSIDPTKLTKAQRRELLNSYTGELKLTDEQKKEFIETGSISGTTISSSSPSEEVTASPSSSSTAK